MNSPEQKYWRIAVVIFLSFCGQRAMQGSDAPPDRLGTEKRQYEDRIQKLEARIDRLEQMVTTLSRNANVRPSEQAPTLAPPGSENAQTPEASVPAADFVKRVPFETPPELLPEVGKIGAEVGVLAGGSANPFKLNSGSFFGGFIDLPLFDRPSWLHGKVSYELSVGLSQSKTTFNTTSNVAQIANLTALNAFLPGGGLSNIVSAVNGDGPAPFATTMSTETRLKLLQVVPFALKYTTTAFDKWRLRPYVIAGFGTYVTIHEQNPAQGNPPTYGVRPDAQLPPAALVAVTQTFGGQAPFGGPLVAGQLSQSPELEARGLPSGHGNIDFGLHTGGGIAFRLTRELSFGIDARYNKISGANASFTTYGSRISFHF